MNGVQFYGGLNAPTEPTGFVQESKPRKPGAKPESIISQSVGAEFFIQCGTPGLGQRHLRKTAQRNATALPRLRVYVEDKPHSRAVV